MGEIAKNNLGDNSNNMMIILKKIISNEKLILPRLKIFEKIVPSPNDWKILLNSLCKFNEEYYIEKNLIIFLKLYYTKEFYANITCIYINYNNY